LIQVGQVLDKYELLERVGQGGMAVVYRGIDRQLKRTVAIKILHKHLSDYQEARDRFEREAQAVAKLRHENILEIFDYAAKESESYIVTEFIDGQTLKQFITERPIQYPEVGAMIMLQVARALAHAHAGGILHRDIKPENIMIRSDGVVKLMDFGISHMVDLERLTVTGQLLGSPAYMAPEHVEGRPLDFRTDVFAVGIVLYQLSVGKLPFEGKNPHEVLKRIAECKFVDPRQANPRIGNKLGKIILKAMAAAPDDRFPAITEMVLALEGYLSESGLPTDKVPGELGRYFKAPAAYELALRERLIDTLTRRGQELLDEDNTAGALDVFDRILTMDPENPKVLAILDRLNRRARMKHVAIGVAAVLAIGGGAFAIQQKNKPAPPEVPSAPSVSVGSDLHTPATQIAHLPPLPAELDAGVGEEPPNDGDQRIVVAPAIDAAVAEPTTVLVTAFPNDSTISVDGGPFTPIGQGLKLTVAKKVHVVVRSDIADAQERDIEPGAETQDFKLSFKRAKIVPHCAVAGATVTFGDKPWNLDQPRVVFFDVVTEQRVKVDFYIGNPPVQKTTTVRIAPGETKEVRCEDLP
jgi:tRNA A-37 threonylcarbamoyl transferase component Bud32